MNSHDLERALKEVSTGSTAAFVARKIAERDGILIRGGTKTRAEKHVSENGELGSERAQALLAEMSKRSAREIVMWVGEQHALIAERVATVKAQIAADPLFKVDQDELDTWWETEGKYEEQIEAAGQGKYYTAERERLALEGETLSAVDFLSSGARDDDGE